MDCAALASPEMVARFLAFGSWLVGEVGPKKAALRIHRHLPFFIAVDRKWAGFPDYLDLVTHFGPRALRRAELPMRWLVGSGLIVVDKQQKEDASEGRRIAATVNVLAPGSPERNLLVQYRDHRFLAFAEGSTSLRSVRLSLFPAAALLQKGVEAGLFPPNQDLLCTYLDKKPGQRAAVSGFVRFLREVVGVDIFMPEKNPGLARRRRRHHLEAQLKVLLEDSGDSPAIERRWVRVALEYFHGLPSRSAKRIKNDDILVERGGLSVPLDGKEYWIPARSAETRRKAEGVATKKVV